jgi:hypothetical protein
MAALATQIGSEPQVGGRLPRLWRWLRRIAAEFAGGVGHVLRSPSTLLGRGLWQRTARVGLILLNLVGLYFLIGMIQMRQIDNDPGFSATQVTEGGLRSVDIAAALIEREVTTNEWVMNSPPFSPGVLLDNMAAFQDGIMYGLGRFTTEMVDNLARSRGSSQVDPNLDRANGLLRYPGDIWTFELGQSLAPQITSEEQYRAARNALLSYNTRLANGEALFDPRPDNLLILLERIIADVGSQAALLDRMVWNGPRSIVDPAVDWLFFNTKGRIYAYYMLLRELEHDFADVIQQQGLGRVWSQMLGGFREAASHVPFMVINGEPGGLFTPSHLAEQGFMVLRAKTQLLDVAAVLSAR